VLARVMGWFPGLEAHEVDALLTWAVGDDWAEVRFSEWPARIRKNTQLPVADDDLVLSATERLTEEWKKLRNGQQMTLPLETPAGRNGPLDEPGVPEDEADEAPPVDVPADQAREEQIEPQDLLREALSPKERYGRRDTYDAKPGEYLIVDFDANPFNVFTFGSIDEAKRFMNDRPPSFWEGEGRYLVAKVVGWAKAKVEMTIEINEG
jgi:hypothetical protein